MTLNKPTKVRFTLSRFLSWAERNDLAMIIKEEIDAGVLGHQVKTEIDKLGNKVQVVYVYAHIDSRYLAEEFHQLLAREFVNVRLKAIETLYPRVKV